MPKLNEVEKREVEIKKMICDHIANIVAEERIGECTSCRKLARKIIKKLGLEVSDWPNNVE